MDEFKLSCHNLSRFFFVFANLYMLKRLDLLKNHLKGVIQNALTTVITLRILNVSNNDISGLVLRFKHAVEVAAKENPLVC